MVAKWFALFCFFVAVSVGFFQELNKIMPAPTITRPATAIDYGNTITATAPLLKSALPATSYGLSNASFTYSAGNRYGARVALPAPVNIAARKWLKFKFNISPQWGFIFGGDGFYIICYDTVGNWSRYLIYTTSTGRPNWLDFKSVQDGYFGPYTSFESSSELDVLIALNSTPTESSGTIDWSQLAGYEFGFVTASGVSGTQSITIGRMSALDDPMLVNGDVSNKHNLSKVAGLITSSWAATTVPYRDYRHLRAAPANISIPSQGNIFTSAVSVVIGDGTTTTVFEDTGSLVTFRASYASGLDQYASIYDSSTSRREFKTLGVGAGSITLTDFTIVGCNIDGGDYDVNLTIGTFTNGEFVYAGVCNTGSSALNDITFYGCKEVVFSASCTYTGCSIINNARASSKGLTINAAPGDYSAIDIYFADNTGGHDVEITPTATGTYDLSGLSVKTGQSLKIHNTTATAITVKLATGVTATTSGTGAITIEYPVSLANAAITNLVAGSRVRIYNQTTDTELFNDIVAGTSYSADYIDGTDYSAGDIISVRVAWMGGTSAKLPVEYLAVSTVNGWSVLANQQDDTVYNTNAIDGSTVTEFIADYPNVQIDVDDPDGTTTPQRCYAWYIAGQMTADGITNYHGAITAEDEFNYRVNVDVVSLHGQNISTNPLLVVGARIYRSDGAALFVPGSGPVQMEYGRTYALETGVSGLTPTESAALLAIPTNPLLTNDARLDNLDAAVSTRLPASSYTAAPTTTQIRTELATELSRIDAPVSSRLADADYVAPDNTAVLSAIAALHDLSDTEVQAMLATLPAVILSAAQSTPIHADTQKINGADVIGDGTDANKWRGAGV